MSSEQTFALAAIFMAIVVFFWAIVVVRKLTRNEIRARSRISDLEARLNETEAALAAEPHVLYIWRGRDTDPEQISNDMRGQANVPEDKAQLADFGRWLERESSAALSVALKAMREVGTPFNIGVKTLEGELLEADGRTAGGLAMLRLRPLSGDRRNVTELSYDARKLGRQVKRLSAILDRAPLSIWLRDEEGHLTWINQAYMAAIENDDIDEVLERRIELAGASKLPEAVEDGQDDVRHMHTHAVIGGANRALDIYEIRLEGGSAGFAVDSTAAEEAKKELKRHVRAQTGMLDKLTTAIAIFGPDKRLRFFNAAYAQLWSLPQGWLESEPADGEILDKLREARRLPEQANYRDWKEQQLAAYTTLEAREDWWHLPDGQTVRVVAEQHPFGGVTYFYENVTEKITLESRYNELIGVQRETLDNLHEAVALFGADGCLKLHNPPFARFWLLDEAFLDSKPHIDQVIASCRTHYEDDAYWDEVKFTITELSENRSAIQERLSRSDGMILEMASVPLPDGNTLVAFVDVTSSARMERALRERNEALEAADRLKTDFLSNVSYELRTPLNSIIGFAEYLSLGMAGELAPKQNEYVSDIRKSSADLLSIIDAILDLTTIDAGAMELQLGAVDIGNLLEETGQAAASAIKKRDLTLNIEIAEDIATVKADARRLGQVLTHLLSNAIGFSEVGGVIRMGASLDGTDVLLWVADTGKGMEPEFQQRVFDRFQSRPAVKGHRGAGLGLSLVKSFVELHDGKVSLRSRPNKGTTVICRLPIAGPQDGDVRRETSASSPQAIAAAG